MELPGSGYLYALATISVTFVGFSSLVLVFRQTIGGTTTRYDSYFVLAFMQVGFIVAGGCLLPPLLALFGLTESMVWRAASGVASLPILLFVATVPRRRRGALSVGRGYRALRSDAATSMTGRSVDFRWSRSCGKLANVG